MTTADTQTEATAAADAPESIAIVRDLLSCRARTLGLLPDDSEDAAVDDAIEQLLDREVQTPEPTDEECRRFYTTHPERFTSGELAFVRHILFAVTPAAPLDAIRAKAEETLRQLHREPGMFEDFATRWSNCPSGQQGGNLGQLSRGECVPEFDDAVFAGPSRGLLPQLVRTRFGFHIVAVDGRVPGKLVPLDAVRDQVAAYLRSSVQRKALEQYVRLLAAESRVAVPGLTPAASPLLQ
jgi:peptidyl-prolyl cis-trans isomerase C